jgi:hypothetical protein
MIERRRSSGLALAVRGLRGARKVNGMRVPQAELTTLFGSGPAGIRGEDWGGMRVMVVTLPAGTDITPLLKDLPGDRCPCPHWGYMVRGRLRVTYADRAETLVAGDLWYMPPGHTALVEEDAEFIEFSRSDEHERVLEVVRRNAGAVSAGSA